MMVDPNLPDHPKYRRLKRRLGPLPPGESAAEVLLRLWAHCQGNQRGEFWAKKTAGYVEDIAGWAGTEGQLAAALEEPYGNEPGWITIDGEGVRINGWNEHNRTLLVKWNANPSGKAKGSAAETLKGSHFPPLRPPDRIGLDRIGGEGTRAGEAAPAENPEKKEAPVDGQAKACTTNEEPHVPSVGEVVAEGQMPGCGVPEGYCVHFWEKHGDGSTSWFDGHGNLRPWQKRLRNWWGKDRHRPEWKKPAVKKSREEQADLEAQLQLAKEPGEIEVLRRRLEEARL